MRRYLILFFILLFLTTQSGVAEAAYSLKVTVTDINQIWMSTEKSKFIKGDPEILLLKKKLTTFAKTNQAKNQAIAMCKEEGVYYNTRIKVLDARRGTAGLGTLKSITVSNMKIVSRSADLPEYSQEEWDFLEGEYSLYSEYPDYIEDGYVDNFLEFKCSVLGIVSTVPSNFYQIYLDGDFLGEYSKTELIRMKWTISVREDEV
jgi:hypothetical protein